MNFLLWLWLMEEERKRNEEEDSDGLWPCYIPYRETRWDRFCKKHPVIDRVWLYAAGLALGLLPLLSSYAILKLGGVF